MTKRVAMLSVHTCPLAGLGGRDTGGMNVYVRQLARDLARRNFAVDVFTRQRFGRGPRIVEDGPGVRDIHLEAGPPGPMDKETIYEHLPEFAARVDEFRRTEGLCYDRIHAHYWLSGLVAADLRRRWNVPTLIMFHTLARVKNLYIGEGETADSELRAQGEQRAMDMADCIVAANSIERDHMLSQYRVDPAKISIAPLGVDTSIFRPQDRQRARADLGLAGKQLVFSVGRIEPLIIVDGVAISNATRSNQLIQRLGLAEVVQLLGSLPQVELPRYYAAADCVVVPSHYESFGLVAVEAMACGTPVVASRVGGLSLSVKDGETGFLVPARDDAAFADRIGRLVRSPELVTRLGQAAAVAGRAYSWRSVTDRILDLYGKFGKVCTRPAPVPVETRRYATTCSC